MASFAEAVYAGAATVEGITARRVADTAQAWLAIERGEVAVAVDPHGQWLRSMMPRVVVDARLAKVNLGTRREDALFVIGLGPGFTAGADCHAVVETKRGHTLGRVIWQGSALPDTGVPDCVAGHERDRVLRAPAAGHVLGRLQIGDSAAGGEVVAEVAGVPIAAPFAGVLRGLIHPEVPVEPGMKVGDFDPRGVREYCFTISDKALAVAGGVLEAVLVWQRMGQAEQGARSSG